MYVLQRRFRNWEPWETLHKRYTTLAEAEAALEKALPKSIHRIAEEYQVTRYKAVKKEGKVK